MKHFLKETIFKEFYLYYDLVIVLYIKKQRKLILKNKKERLEISMMKDVLEYLI